MSGLALFFLGPPRLELDGEPIHIGRRKAVALLAYLAVTGHSHSRDSLATLLWPEYDQSRSRADLRRTLSLLNRALGKGWLAADRETAGLNPDADVRLDVAQFRARLAERQHHSHPPEEMCPDCVPLLEQAIEFYHDDFLAGFTLQDSLAFDEWQFFQTQGLRDQLAGVLERLVCWHSEQGEYDPAIEYARRWLALDPLHEPAHRRLMALHAQAGRRAAALRQYRTCLRTLEEELGVPPTAETLTLYQRLREEREVTAPAPAPTPPTPTHLPGFLRPAQDANFGEKEEPAAVARPVFVAREPELARLEGYLEAALGGQAQVVFVIGGPGRGKTALLTEFARRAMDKHPNLLAASGSCHARSGISDPYLPFCEVMNVLTGGVEGQWAAGVISREHAQRLWDTFPWTVQTILDHGPHTLEIFVPGTSLLSRIAAAAPDGAPWLRALRKWIERPEGSADRLEQGQIFQQFIDVVRALAETHPLLLTLDDMQWADAASISLLSHLGRRLEASRVLIACAYRPEEVTVDLAGVQHPLRHPLAEFKRRFGNVWVDLSQTDAAQGRRFVDALLDTEPNRLGQDFRVALHQRTLGHPLFTVELLRTMQEREDLVKDDAHQWIQGPRLDWQTMPARVEAVIEARVDRLDEDLRDILSVASVEGQRFTAQVVADVQDISEREVLRVLSRELGARHRLVREAGEVRVDQRFLSRYQFAHTLFQSYLYNTLSAGERRLLHSEIGETLERLWGDQTGEVAAQLARHYFLAGHRKKAAAYSMRAAYRARLGYADEEAMAFYQQAVAIAAEEPRAKDTIKFTISEFNEAPMLAELVASGDLPPVEERLPEKEDIQVIEPVEGIGKYGGTWLDAEPYHLYDMVNLRMILYDPPIRWKADYSGYEPGLLRAWDISGDGTRITWQFRKGVKWSDGRPFTTDDVRFWWEDMATNPDVAFNAVPLWGCKSDGTPMDVSFPDDYTMVMEWDTPRYITVFEVAQGYWWWDSMMKPRHYLEQFHPTYTTGASYKDLEMADRWWQTPGYPTLYAWIVESVTPGERIVLVRNPFYWKVDTAGIQLPYIDRLDVSMVPDKEVRLLAASQGRYTACFRPTLDPRDLPFLAERSSAGRYRLHPGAVSGSGGWPCWIVNQDFNDQSLDNWDEIRDLLRDKRFRRALSHAMDRQRIIDIVWEGVGMPQQGTISPQSWHFAGHDGQRIFAEWANAYVEYDPGLANRLLDEVGLVDANGDIWRDLPNGAPFQLSFDVLGWGGPAIAVEATELFANDLNNVGINTRIHKMIGSAIALSSEAESHLEHGLFMLIDCHIAELDIWTYPAWIFPLNPLGQAPRTWPLQGTWRSTRGTQGAKPIGVAKALLEIYDRGLIEADMNKRHELVWEAIRIHIDEGPFLIGACGDQPMPVVIADNFRGVPDLVVLGPWAPGTPGNLHPEQFWIDR